MIRKEQLRLYAITDTSWLNGASLIDVVENVLKNGATFLQLREKNATHEEIVAKAKAIKPIARKYGVPFVIDDDVQAALEADADGVHIGQSDTDYMTARSILGDNKIIGMTAKTVEQAKEAERLGADYIGTGAVFGSSTKKDAVFMPRERLIEVAGSVISLSLQSAVLITTTAESLQVPGLTELLLFQLYLPLMILDLLRKNFT